MPQHSVITDPDIHEPKGASSAGTDTVLRADGLGATSWVDPNTLVDVAGFQYERVLEGESVAVSQGPSATDTIHKVEFGPAVNTVSEPVMLAADGTITFNQVGSYSLKTLFHFSRTGGTGQSIVHFRGVINNAIQGGFTLTIYIDSSSDLTPFEDIVNLHITSPGTTLHYEMYRDSAGNNSGDLVRTVPSLAGPGPLDWAESPSAFLRVERFIPNA